MSEGRGQKAEVTGDVRVVISNPVPYDMNLPVGRSDQGPTHLCLLPSAFCPLTELNQLLAMRHDPRFLTPPVSGCANVRLRNSPRERQA
jgi:hypothetical protein